MSFFILNVSAIPDCVQKWVEQVGVDQHHWVCFLCGKDSHFLQSMVNLVALLPSRHQLESGLLIIQEQIHLNSEDHQY